MIPRSAEEALRSLAKRANVVGLVNIRDPVPPRGPTWLIAPDKWWLQTVCVLARRADAIVVNADVEGSGLRAELSWIEAHRWVASKTTVVRDVREVGVALDALARNRDASSWLRRAWQRRTAARID